MSTTAEVLRAGSLVREPLTIHGRENQITHAPSGFVRHYGSREKSVERGLAVREICERAPAKEWSANDFDDDGAEVPA